MLSDDQARAVRAASAALDQAARDAAAAVDGVGMLQRGWATLIGAGSTLDAAAGDAAAEQKLADVMRAKLPSLIANGSFDDAIQYVRDCGRYADVSAMQAALKQTAPATAFKEVVVQSVEDAAGDAWDMTVWFSRYWWIVVGGIGVVAAWPVIRPWVAAGIEARTRRR